MRYTNLILVLSLMANGFLLCLLIFNPFGRSEVETKVVRTTDTVHTVREIHTQKQLPGKVVRKERIDTVFLRDTLKIEPEDLAKRRIYSDTIFQDSARLYYRHSIIGALEHSEYSLFVPERTIIDRQETTVTEVIDRKWQVFGSLQLQGDRISYGGALYRDGVGLQYHYEPATKSHRVGVGVRIIGW